MIQKEENAWYWTSFEFKSIRFFALNCLNLKILWEWMMRPYTATDATSKGTGEWRRINSNLTYPVVQKDLQMIGDHPIPVQTLVSPVRLGSSRMHRSSRKICKTQLLMLKIAQEAARRSATLHVWQGKKKEF